MDIWVYLSPRLKDKKEPVNGYLDVLEPNIKG